MTINVFTGTVQTGFYESLVSGNSVFDLLYNQFNTTGFLLVGSALLAASGLLAIKGAPSPYELRSSVRDFFRRKKHRNTYHEDAQGYYYKAPILHNRLDDESDIEYVAVKKKKDKRKKKTMGGMFSSFLPSFMKPDEDEEEEEVERVFVERPRNVYPVYGERPFFPLRPPLKLSYVEDGFDPGFEQPLRRHDPGGGGRMNAAPTRSLYQWDRKGASQWRRPLVFQPTPPVPTWRGPTTTVPRVLQVYTRPHVQQSANKNRLKADSDLDNILERLRDSAYQDKKNRKDYYGYDDQDEEYYYDDYNFEPQKTDSKTATAAATTTVRPPRAAQYLAYFNRPFNMAGDGNGAKNTFVTQSYRQVPLSKYYKRRRRKRRK